MLSATLIKVVVSISVITLLIAGLVVVYAEDAAKDVNFTATVNVQNMYEGDNAPYENVTFQVPGHGLGYIILNCNLLKNGSSIALHYGYGDGIIQARSVFSSNTVAPGCLIQASGVSNP